MNLSMQFLPQIKQKFTGGVMPVRPSPKLDILICPQKGLD